VTTVPSDSGKVGYDAIMTSVAIQLKMIDLTNTRSTWAVTTGAGVIAALLSQVGNIGNARGLTTGSIWLFVIGGTIAALSVLVALWSAGIWSYRTALDPAALRMIGEGIDEQSLRSILATEWSKKYATNEDSLRFRSVLLRCSFWLLAASAVELVVSALYLLNRAVPGMFSWF
jgi:hypothetical protein